MTEGCKRGTRTGGGAVMLDRFRYLSATLALAAGLAACAGKPVIPSTGTVEPARRAEFRAEDPRKVEKGDLVAVRYTATLEDGAPVRTVEGEEVIAGESASMPGLADGVVGMAPGGKTDFTVPPEKGYGLSDPAKIVRFPSVRRAPRIARVPAAEYVKRFGTFPTVGKEVDLVPYARSRVTAVTEQEAELAYLGKDGDRFEEDLGATETRVDGEQVIFRLIPRVGAPFPGQGVEGRITGADNDAFTVDYNPPLAGRALVYRVEALSLVKASRVRDAKIAWGEDHDRGLAEAKRARKPVVLVLYAEWCSWCKKLFGESLPDPRIRMLSDRFVWVKVNSDLDKKIYGKYGQNGFPLIVLLSPDGDVVGRIDGFRDGAALYGELSSLLKGKKERAS